MRAVPYFLSKLIFFTLFVTLVALCLPNKALAVTWTRANDDGFGDTTGQDDFFDFIVYHDCLYAGIESQSTTEGARVHRTCDGTTWTQVMEDGFGDPPENDHVDSFAEFGEYLYVSTAVPNSGFSGFKVWRSKTGSGGWEEVVNDGAGDNRNENLKAFEVFNGWLCGGTWNSTLGTGIWCTQDGTTWVQKNTDGFGSSSNTITWHSAVFNGYLYFSMQNSNGGQIWRTNDLSNWEQITSDGFGYGSAVTRIRGLEVFKNELYTIVKNGSNDSEVLKSSDGVNFTEVSTLPNANSLGPAGSERGFLVFDDYLHVGASNSVDGFDIYRSRDGLTWEQIASNGIDNITAQSYVLLAGFHGYLYAGTRNASVGQKVWRTYYFDHTNKPAYSGPDIPPICAGTVPPFAPELFQIKTDSSTATLYFTPVNNNSAHYELLYGESDNTDAKYGARIDFGESSGAIPFEVKSLKSNTKYWFMVMAANVCGPGPWSNVLEASSTGLSNLVKHFHLH